MPNDTELLETIVQRLNVLIALQLDAVSGSGDNSTASRIHRLADLGLSPAQVGSIIGKKANYVSAVLGSKRRKLNRD
jgi:hypothetical protein